MLLHWPIVVINSREIKLKLPFLPRTSSERHLFMQSANCSSKNNIGNLRQPPKTSKDPLQVPINWVIFSGVLLRKQLPAEAGISITCASLGIVHVNIIMSSNKSIRRST